VLKLNLRYGKPQILRMYADTVYFGHQFYGSTRPRAATSRCRHGK